MVDIDAYLRRINYRGAPEPTPGTLRDLHRAHLLAVPFENLDIHLRRPIVLNYAAFFHKVVVDRRGGFCYELNGLFSALLRALGFEVTLLSAGVCGADGQFGPEFDHLALLVHSDGLWLADVGFGDSFVEPLRFEEGRQQPSQAEPPAWERRTFRLIAADGHWLLQRREGSEPWQASYRFTLEPRRLGDFARMCHYQQTSPESSFTRRRICSLATPEGRVTLSDMRLITTARGQREERLLADESEVSAVLRDRFGVVLPPQADLGAPQV